MTALATEMLTGVDLVVAGGQIFRDAAASESDEAMLITGGRVHALGTREDVVWNSKPGTPILELEGRTVLPGLIDAHTHVQFSALARSHWLDVRNLSVADVLDRVARRASAADSSEWVIAQGTFLQSLPSRIELDQASPRVPVIVRESMHRLVANSRAIELAGLDDGTRDHPPGMVIHRDTAGRATGIVEEGFDAFPIPEPSPAELRQILGMELETQFASRGVTTVYEIPASRGGVEAYCGLANDRTLPVRLALNPVLGAGLAPLLDSTDDWDPERFGGGAHSDLIWPGAIKIFVDGDNRQAFDRTGLAESPPQFGAVTRTLSRLTDELVWATSAGIQVWIHAIGDLAQEFALEAIAESRRRVGPPRLPTRLEHAGNLNVEPGILRRMEKLGVIPVPTASFIATDDGTGTYGFSSLMKAGFRPPGNSDTGGAIADAPNPWFGIALMMSRRNSAGDPVAEHEAVSVLDGLRSYTTFAASAAGLEQVIGSLNPGSAADFAVYLTDPRQNTPEELMTLQSEQTFVGGRQTWQRTP